MESERRLEKSLGSWNCTRMKLEDNPIKFINEKIVYFDQMKLFLDEKIGKCLNPEDEMIEEQVSDFNRFFGL